MSISFINTFRPPYFHNYTQFIPRSYRHSSVLSIFGNTSARYTPPALSSPSALLVLVLTLLSYITVQTAAASPVIFDRSPNHETVGSASGLIRADVQVGATYGQVHRKLLANFTRSHENHHIIPTMRSDAVVIDPKEACYRKMDTRRKWRDKIVFINYHRVEKFLAGCVSIQSQINIALNSSVAAVVLVGTHQFLDVDPSGSSRKLRTSKTVPVMTMNLHQSQIMQEIILYCTRHNLSLDVSIMPNDIEFNMDLSFDATAGVTSGGVVMDVGILLSLVIVFMLIMIMLIMKFRNRAQRFQQTASSAMDSSMTGGLTSAKMRNQRATSFQRRLVEAVQSIQLKRKGLGSVCELQKAGELLGLPNLPSNQERRTDQMECVICLEPYKIKETVRVLPGCKHEMHRRCVDGWLLENHRCPICKRNILDTPTHRDSATLETPVEDGLSHLQGWRPASNFPSPDQVPLMHPTPPQVTLHHLSTTTTTQYNTGIHGFQQVSPAVSAGVRQLENDLLPELNFVVSAKYSAHVYPPNKLMQPLQQQLLQQQQTTNLAWIPMQSSAQLKNNSSSRTTKAKDVPITPAPSLPPHTKQHLLYSSSSRQPHHHVPSRSRRRSASRDRRTSKELKGIISSSKHRAGPLNSSGPGDNVPPGPSFKPSIACLPKLESDVGYLSDVSSGSFL